MEMNAREAMHVVELRTSPQGHPSYRRVCQAMHRLIEKHHPVIAKAMRHVDHSAVGLERLESERRTEVRRSALDQPRAQTATASPMEVTTEPNPLIQRVESPTSSGAGVVDIRNPGSPGP
jgi:thymidylate synthase ThyX